MSKHTPGPWYWDFDRDDLASLRSDHEEDGPVMIDVDCYPDFADRCLIAAAPDLLEALESLAEDYRRKEGLGFDLLTSTKMFRAIARAKGESQ